QQGEQLLVDTVARSGSGAGVDRCQHPPEQQGTGDAADAGGEHPHFAGRILPSRKSLIWVSGTSVDAWSRRPLYSTVLASTPRSPTTSRWGMPISSISASIAPRRPFSISISSTS